MEKTEELLTKIHKQLEKSYALQEQAMQNQEKKAEEYLKNVKLMYSAQMKKVFRLAATFFVLIALLLVLQLFIL